MPSPQVYSGQIATADQWNSMIPKLITQENDQTVTSATTGTTYIDSEIQFQPESNATYLYWLWISYSTESENPDFKWRWQPETTGGVLFCSFTQAYVVGATGTFNSGASIIQRRPGNTTDRVAGGNNGTATFLSAYDQGSFTTDANPSLVKMQFAQNTSHADDTILRGGNQTRMAVQRIR
jgi:hypothetical protein